MKSPHIPGAFIATAFIAVLLSLLANSVSAATHSSAACQQLASVVEHSVVRTLQMERGLGRVSASAPSSGLQGCATATATVSQAFSDAMRGLGVELAWNNGRMIDPGDFCLSHYLDQCYPRRSGLEISYSLANNAVISTAWATVTANVRQAMPFGMQSDIVYFDSAQLATTLTSSLQVTLRTPAWGAQQNPRHIRSR